VYYILSTSRAATLLDPALDMPSLRAVQSVYALPWGSTECICPPLGVQAEKQRERILDRFGNARFSPADRDVCLHMALTRETLSQMGEILSLMRENCLGPSTSNPLQCTKLPASIQQSMWAKVKSYRR